LNLFFLQQKVVQKVKEMTKGRFPADYPTNAKVWIADKIWEKKAND